MFEELKKGFSLKLLVVFSTIAVGIYLGRIGLEILGQFSDIIIILIASWLLSFILEPSVIRISKITRLSKLYSTAITYLLLAGLFTASIFILIPIVTAQIKSFSSDLPRLLESSPIFTKNLENLNETIAKYLNNSISVITSIAQFFFYTFIVLIISFYFIVDKERINNELYELLPDKWHKNLKFIEKVIDESFGSFLRVQLIIGVIAGILTWIVLRILGIEFAAFASLLAGIFAIVPMVGPILSIIPPVAVALLDDYTKALAIFIILLLLQQVIFNVVGPKLLGKSLKLHPVIILLSFLIGGKLAGGLGAILAIPVLGIFAVAVKKLSKYFLKPNQA